MDKNSVEVGKKYICQAIGVSEELSGKVTHKLENCVIVSVDNCASCDEEVISEKVKMVVAKYIDLREFA